jgi:putative tryptophan/tyrosine transport system substrate-binding protein
LCDELAQLVSQVRLLESAQIIFMTGARTEQISHTTTVRCIAERDPVAPYNAVVVWEAYMKSDGVPGENSMISRRKLLIALGASSLAAPLGLFAQQQGKVWRIGFLQAGPRPADGLPPAALRKALAEFGYAEGNSVVYEGRWAEGKVARLPELAAELVQHRVDAIVVLGWPATRAVKNATSTIPIVIAFAGEAVGTGLVVSLSRPGANLTGISDMAVELAAKRMELLKETVPKASRIAILWNQDDLGMTLRYREIDRAARALGVSVQALGVREPNDFDAAFSAMSREHPDALFMVSDVLTTLNRKRVIEFAEVHRIPAMFEFSVVVQDGGLMSYGPSFDDAFRRIAYYVDRILKGAKPADLPMEQPTRFYLFLNLKTARALGIKIPQSILARADQVIE